MATPIIIDTDPGIDDAVALCLAAASPEITLLGITAVAGNVGLEHTSHNAAALADLLELDVPVGRGAQGPLWRDDTVAATEVHGVNGLGGMELPASSRALTPAVELMAALIRDSDTPVTLVAIGPLTNIASLITLYPEVLSNVARVVFMGGGTGHHLGNVTPAAEFNIYYDPDAAVRVLRSGLPITMVGLNVTNTALVGLSHLPDLADASGPVADITRHLLTTYRSKVEDNGTAQHDSVALAAVIDPTLITTQSCFVDVENTGRLTSGQTVVDVDGSTGNEPNTEVAMTIDLPRFRAMLNERLSRLNSVLAQGSAQ